jgi:hypothetical protein
VVGDLEGLERLLREHPGLAAARIADDQGGSRTPLHVRALIQAGADPNAPVGGSWHAETPLHWAASTAAPWRGGADQPAWVHRSGRSPWPAGENPASTNMRR